MRKLFVTAVVLLLASVDALHGAPPKRQNLLSARIERRVVKSFDFDERGLGNYESVPMNWRSITTPGYPRFLEGQFDNEIGHDAQPSFHFSIQGGSVGAYYLAKDIPVHPGSDYRIIGWIRPQKLKHARAYITAYYLDHALRKIDSSEQRSVGIHGAGDDEPWTQVSIDLFGGVKKARWIALTCRIEQAPKPQRGDAMFHPIHHRDVHGAAWFDDIQVMRFPRVTMSLNAEANVCLPDQPTVCTINTKDLDAAALDMNLDILDAEGTLVESHRLAGPGLSAGETPVTLGDLPAGLYVAKLFVSDGGQPVSAHEQTFLRLNPNPVRASTDDRKLGVIINASSLDYPELTGQLLNLMSPGIVKIPLWRDSMSDEAIVRGDPKTDDLVDTLSRQNVTIVGTLAALPPSLAAQYELPDRTLMAALASDPDRWRPYLALMLTRHGHRINAWQLGLDDRMSGEPSRVTKALANVRSEMQPLIGRPKLVIPHPVQLQVGESTLPADVLCLNVPPYYAADRLRKQFNSFSKDGFDARWATIEASEPERYVRRWRLIEFARRVIAARCADTDAVFIRQPWRFDTIDDEVVVTPHEEFILLRTLSQTLGDLTPATSVWVGENMTAWLFADRAESQGALVVWADAQESKEHRLSISLGDKARQIDLWGNVRAGKSITDGREFTVGAIPQVIRPVSLWRVKMQSSFTVNEPVLQPTIQDHERIVTFTNTHPSKLTGLLHLEAPSGWRIRPKKVALDLAAGESKPIEFTLRIPSNQAVGHYAVLGHLRVAGNEFPSLTLRAPLQVSAPGLDVNVAAYRRGDVLRIVQRITNRTDDRVDLKAYLISPERARDQRLVRNLAAGKTVIREYEAPNAEKLSGRHIRVSVEQINGEMRHNTVIRID
ncbi:MAG: NEW3 domain-containing protein [Phycisphaerales bacterium]|nr:NEW3 domain-containing protein [Phycisphaerales bacterium]